MVDGFCLLNFYMKKTDWHINKGSGVVFFNIRLTTIFILLIYFSLQPIFNYLFFSLSLTNFCFTYASSEWEKWRSSFFEGHSITFSRWKLELSGRKQSSEPASVRFNSSQIGRTVGANWYAHENTKQQMWREKNSWNTKNFFGLGNTNLKPANLYVTKWKLVLGSAVIVYKLMYLKQLVFSHLYIKSSQNKTKQKFKFTKIHFQHKIVLSKYRLWPIRSSLFTNFFYWEPVEWTTKL